jgi:membrane fusion protein (multidrug efflux system)
VDTYPGTKFTGRVESIMAGTGAVFSLLPPENATGNWVKVVQRIPVRISLKPPFPENQPLRLGMSCVVTIDTRERSGPRLLTQKRVK